jgi:uncharacterized membrane protein
MKRLAIIGLASLGIATATMLLFLLALGLIAGSDRMVSLLSVFGWPIFLTFIVAVIGHAFLSAIQASRDASKAGFTDRRLISRSIASFWIAPPISALLLFSFGVLSFAFYGVQGLAYSIAHAGMESAAALLISVTLTTLLGEASSSLPSSERTQNQEKP